VDKLFPRNEAILEQLRTNVQNNWYVQIHEATNGTLRSLTRGDHGRIRQWEMSATMFFLEYAVLFRIFLFLFCFTINYVFLYCVKGDLSSVWSLFILLPLFRCCFWYMHSEFSISFDPYQPPHDSESAAITRSSAALA